MPGKKSVIDSIKKYVRAANYLTVAQIHLKENFLLKKRLSPENIKPRLLGHWGTCPGINFVYANLNHLVKKHNQSTMFVLGPGHGFPALQANLFLEGTLTKFYPKITKDKKGIINLCKPFSWPYGFPSHSNPGTPGVILEGGELGYSLSTSYGAILDNPDLLVACLVGDGEAETGPTATAWHVNKFIDPKTNGTVLPILHLNGYKISGPTIFGRMSNKELKSLFYGYGYQPFIVEGNNIYEKMFDTLEQAYKIIKKLKSTKLKEPPRFPMIILKTPKGWTGIKELHGKKIEGNCESHQVVVKNAKTSKKELDLLEQWMKSYNFDELFNEKKGFCKEIQSLVPKDNLKIGNNKHAFSKKIRKDLILPNIKEFSENTSVPGTIGSSNMRRAGAYLNKVFQLNKKNIRLMSPDETYSNKLDAVFNTTNRAFVWPIKEWDEDIAKDGRVIEMLSEHTLQGLTQGYILTGRHAIFTSYESFIEIVSSMADQYEKFLKVAMEIPWRKDISSFNYILTSSGWRQEHNGFSHQSPKFVSSILEKPNSLAKAYFPADGNLTLVTLEHCLKSKNCINVIVAGKRVEPRWLTLEQAREELKNGLMIWNFASDKKPDLVFSSIGDYVTNEVLAAISILREIIPKIRLRYVNVLEISSLGIGKISKKEFNDYFTKNKPVIFSYHGYPEAIKSLLLEQNKPKRFSIHGFIEKGSTTTPFDMHIRNKTSRYHLVIEAVEKILEERLIFKQKANELIEEYKNKIKEHHEYILQYGKDPEEIENWQWKNI